jgi:glycosyltransferase involved in cell wall biosynthesis
MKIMILEPNPSYGGGCEAMSLAIGRQLVERGHEVCLLHELNGSMLAAYEEFITEKIQMHLPCFALRAPLSTLSCAMRIGRCAHTRGVDAVLSSHLGYIRSGALVRGLYGVPFCFHLGLPAVEIPWFSRTAYYLISAGVCPSRHTQEAWYRAGWPSRTLVTIPNWVDTERFRPMADRNGLRQQLGIPHECRCIVFVGRICREKGVESLVRAFAVVQSKVKNAVLLIVGEAEPEYGKQFSDLINGIGPEVRERIHLTGISPTPEKYLAAADVACVPSVWNEAFGLTLLEAMACGLPVISTTVGILPQILGLEHGDLVVPPEDTTALTERLVWWLTHPDAAAKVGLQLRRRVVQQYGASSSADAYERVLTNVIMMPNKPNSDSTTTLIT